MGQHRDKMEEDLRLAGLSANTRQTYLGPEPAITRYPAGGGEGGVSEVRAARNHDMRVTPQELRALGITHHLHVKHDRLERPRHPYGGDILESGKAQPGTGTAELRIVGSEPALVIDWRRYHLPMQRQDTFLGALSVAGRPIEVTERALHIHQTNTSCRVFEGAFTSDHGVCCDELLRAARDRAALEPGPGGKVILVRSWRDDVIWHDSDWVRTYVRLDANLAKRKATLRRIYVDDASQ